MNQLCKKIEGHRTLILHVMNFLVYCVYLLTASPARKKSEMSYRDIHLLQDCSSFCLLKKKYIKMKRTGTTLLL